VPSTNTVEALRRWDPEQVGGYALIGRLGAGAMGQVYLGRSAAGRLVAIKTIRVEYAEDPDFRIRFAQEVAAARRVSGAFTAPVVAADPEADVPWLATAYVPAPSLSTLVRACGPMSVRAVRWLGAGCAEALESIHNAGLVHRDLKPSNVLVSPDGPRVIDFGVARAVERVQLTLTRGTLGTPAFMAPEQARDTRQATSASDVYSLGATLVLAATGHSPYRGETVMDVLVQLATSQPDLSELPPELAGVVGLCMDRDPRRRPTAAGLLAHLAVDLAPDAAPGESGRQVLSGRALALIAEYRHEPSPQDAPETGEDDTFGSQPALGDPGALAGADAADPVASGGPVPSVAGRREAAPPVARRPARRPARRSGRRIAAGLTAVAAGVVLVAGGAALGAYVGDGRANPAAGSRNSPSQTRGGTTSPSAAATSPDGSGPPGGVGPPPLHLRRLGERPGRGPIILLSQLLGDGATAFVIRGGGWPPGTRVSVTLVGFGTSPYHPEVDSLGTFSYLINEAQEFVKGLLPPGRYRVRVSDAGITKSARFTVNDLIPGRPPP
jgi:hypothetical protein